MKHANQYSDIIPCFKWRTFNSSYISGTETDIQWKRETAWIFINFIIIIINSFYIALFSALEQTHCAHVACDSEGYLLQRVFLISTEVAGVLVSSALWLLHGWWHVKCCRIGESSVYTIQPCTSLQCHLSKPHRCVFSCCHLPPALLVE